MAGAGATGGVEAREEECAEACGSQNCGGDAGRQRPVPGAPRASRTNSAYLVRAVFPLLNKIRFLLICYCHSFANDDSVTLKEL